VADHEGELPCAQVCVGEEGLVVAGEGLFVGGAVGGGVEGEAEVGGRGVVAAGGGGGWKGEGG
jgi:hypothetical protein